MLAEIANLHQALKSSADLTPGDRIAIRNEIGDLEDKVALLDFQECEDIDYGYHAQYDFWHKSLVIKGLGPPGCPKALIIKALGNFFVWGLKVFK